MNSLSRWPGRRQQIDFNSSSLRIEMRFLTIQYLEITFRQ
jgi:hypothetical protein